MLKTKVVEYRVGGGGYISTHKEADIMEGFMSSMGLSGSAIEKALNNNVDPKLDEAKIKFICNEIDYKILYVEVIGEFSYGSSIDHRYGIIYDDSIKATFDENYETVESQFIMNAL